MENKFASRIFIFRLPNGRWRVRSIVEQSNAIYCLSSNLFTNNANGFSGCLPREVEPHSENAL